MTAEEALAKRERRVVRLGCLIADAERLRWQTASAEWKTLPDAPKLRRRYELALDRQQRAESRAPAGDVAEARRRVGLP